MKTKQLSSKQLIALVLILIGAVSSIFGITGLTKSSSEDPYESRNGIVMVYATVYDNEGNKPLIETPREGSDLRLRKGKALLQTLYDDLGNR